MTITETPAVDNGVNVEALLGAKAALTEATQAAAFTWSATSEWVNGTHSRTTVEPYFGLGEAQSHRQPYIVETDHPELFAADDNGATPVEVALAALAGCLVAGVASVATNRSIQLRSVKAQVDGDLDVRGILGIDREVRNGFSEIRVSFDIDADATPDEIAALVAQSQKRSAVYDLLTNPTPVIVETV